MIQFLELVKIISGPLITTSANLYIVSKLINEKINFNRTSLLCFFGVMVTLYINTIYCPSSLKFFASTIILMIYWKLIFKCNIFNIISAVIIGQILFISSEIIYMLFLAVATGKNAETLMVSTIGTLISNISISTIALCLSCFSPAKHIYKVLNNIFGSVSNKKILFFICGAILIINALLAISYFQTSIVVLLIVNGSFIAFVLYILYSILEEKNLNITYRAENDALQDSLHEYENMIDQHRIINHENKNQLRVIKEMIEKDDVSLIPYIVSLTKDTSEKDESILSKTKRIPSGGLQGIIYQKILLAIEKKIPAALNISRDLKISDFKKLDIDTNVDLCKIVGVFLDNAVEEVERLEEKMIVVDVYMEKDAFGIRVTNNYGAGIDFSKLDTKGYTTKETGHGYGLPLVKELVEHNKRFVNDRTVIGNKFSQIIKVHDMVIDE